MRYLSLFSGIEAASCAWQPLGWELKGVCEIEKFPCNVLKHHYPQVPNLGDITKLTREQLEALGPIDLIVGGSPCQGFSVAGKQEGLNDIRSKLAIDYIRVINTVKPRWIVWENVPGVFSTNKGMDFRYFTEVLTRYGFGICWRILDGQWFRTAQRRRRVFLVGYFGDWRPAYKVLFESQSLPRYFETLERKREDLARKTEARTGKTGTGTTCLNPWSEQSKRVQSVEGKSSCLDASADAGGNTIPLVMDTGTAACMGYGKYVETDKAETLRASDGDLGGGSENICYDMAHPVDVIRTYEDGKTPTLEARMGTGGNNIPLVQGSVIGRKVENGPQARVRKLTPTECLRLQGFPDDWFDGVEGYSDTAAYKAIGNSMCVPCMRWIGERIAEVEKEL